MKETELFKVFATLSGSRLYGTNTPESDWDLRGAAIPPIRYFLGQDRFEQFEDKQNDRVYWHLSKLCQLMADANPNAIELLFVPEKYYLHNTPIWGIVVENKDLFLSTKCLHTFSGYAASQLKRIKTHKKWLDNPPQKPDRREMGLSIEHKIDEGTLKALRTISEAKLDPAFVAELRGEYEYLVAKKAWDAYKRWQQERNPERHALEEKYGVDTKHAMHLVRLFRMGAELLSTGTMRVDRRDIDAEELVRIRNGAWDYEQITEYAEKMEAELKGLEARSPLPKKPQRQKINELLISIYCGFFGINLEKAKRATSL